MHGARKIKITRNNFHDFTSTKASKPNQQDYIHYTGSNATTYLGNQVARLLVLPVYWHSPADTFVIT